MIAVTAVPPRMQFPVGLWKKDGRRWKSQRWDFLVSLLVNFIRLMS